MFIQSKLKGSYLGATLRECVMLRCAAVHHYVPVTCVWCGALELHWGEGDDCSSHKLPLIQPLPITQTPHCYTLMNRAVWSQRSQPHPKSFWPALEPSLMWTFASVSGFLYANLCNKYTRLVHKPLRAFDQMAQNHKGHCYAIVLTVELFIFEVRRHFR